MRMKIECRIGEGVTVTVDGPTGPRAENFLPDSIFTPTTLLRELLDWLDRGKTWNDIASDAARLESAGALRALADQIEASAPLARLDRDIADAEKHLADAEQLRDTLLKASAHPLVQACLNIGIPVEVVAPNDAPRYSPMYGTGNAPDLAPNRAAE